MYIFVVFALLTAGVTTRYLVLTNCANDDIRTNHYVASNSIYK